jgi:hypothetical protein
MAAFPVAQGFAVLYVPRWLVAPSKVGRDDRFCASPIVGRIALKVVFLCQQKSLGRNQPPAVRW